MNVKQTLSIASILTICALLAGTQTVYAENSIRNMVKEVIDETGKAVRSTAHSAGIVVRGTAHAAEAVVQKTARGAEAVVDAAEKAAGINSDPEYHQPVAGAQPELNKPAAAPITTSAAAPTKIASAAVSTNTSINVSIDHHGNIIDSRGKLVGRVPVVASDFGASDFAAEKVSVTVNGAGEMIDSSGKIIGHLLGAEPKLVPVAELSSESQSAIVPANLSSPVATKKLPVKPVASQTKPAASGQAPVVDSNSDATAASSWTEDDILKKTAPLLHGL